jgi:tetratricopeptide (TPR) repeat protein
MNKKYRYPGVQAFQKDERNDFFGRDHDKESIFSSILLNRVTVVFGKSGIGKSSLLNAAVIPLLEVYRDNDAEKFEIKRVEAGNYIPKKIYEGLNTSQSSLSNETATKESFDGHGLRSNITKSPGTVSLSNAEDTLVKKIEKKCFPLADDNGHFNFLDEKIRKSLWFQFKKNQQAKTTYIVILDQAEQLFTYPNAEFKEFLEQLAWLTSNYLPDPVRNVIEAQQSNDRSSIPREEYNKLYSPLNIKLVFSIRSDKLHLIPRLNKVIPNILKNTYEVLPLTRLQAELAITEPSKFSGEEFVVEESFTISKQALDKIFIALAEKTTDLDSLDEAYIEPYNLQIICQHIERDIVPNDTDKIIEESELPGDMNDITGKYYYDCIKNLVISSEDERIKIRSFIEDKMIYEEDRRRVTWDKAQITDITADVLNQLVNVRLFEKEMTTESELYKLSHDCLIEPILKAKYERQSDPISQIKKQIDDIKSKTITNEENIKSESFLTSDSTFQRLNPQAINEQTGKNIATRSKDVEKLYDLYKKLGDNYSLVANYDPALEAYNEAIKIAEQNKISPVEAYRARSDVFYYTRNYDLSNKDLEKILELNPDDYQATYNIGLNYKYKGDLDKAKSYLDKSSELNLEFYKKAIETNPKDESSYYQLGEILLERDEYDEAITNFKKALELNPENVNTYNELGRCYYRQKNFQDALTAYEKAIEIDANYYIAIYNIGLVENSLGNEEKALKYFGRAIEITPNYENAYIAMAGIYFNRKDYASARDLYNKLISINPNDEKNFSDLGLIEEYLQNTDAALTNYKKAIEINPYYDLPYYQTGRIFLERSKYDEAIENLKKAIELNPQNANAYNELGRCYYKQKNFEKALSTYKKAIEVNPDYYIAIYNIGLAESELGNKDEALKKFERAIEITPDYENAYIAMAQVYFEKKDYNKAKEMYTKLISINPNDEKIFNDLGLAEENLQNRDAAMNNYKKAIEVNPRYDSPYYQIGRIFLSENNYDEAIKNLKKAIELNPLNAYSQNEL